jgi:hypothetical protein
MCQKGKIIRQTTPGFLGALSEPLSYLVCFSMSRKKEGTMETKSMQRVSPTSPLIVSFFDEADASGTWFEPFEPADSILSNLVEQISIWSARGMPMEEVPWQAAPVRVVSFEKPPGGFFPRGFLGQMEIWEDGKVALSLWERRVERYGDRGWQVEEWTRKCYRSIVHYYQVKKPWQERLRHIRIVRVF